MTGTGAPSGGSSTGYGGQAPHRSYEERAAAREQMMSNIRETSQQDRRVYVGNLSYDVKWHHLKDFMRQGNIPHNYNFTTGRLISVVLQLEKYSSPTCFFSPMECRRWALSHSLWLVFPLCPFSLFLFSCLAHSLSLAFDGWLG
jgi:hypothetical protein